MAALVSTWSKDPSTQCGSIIVRPDRTVASVGFNGFSRVTPDNPAYYDNREEKYSRIIHSEINALIHAGQPVRGFILYNYPMLPCDRCCVQVLQAGIVRIVGLAPSPEQESRWGPAFERTRRYCEEAGVELMSYATL